MSESITVRVDGKPQEAQDDLTVAALLWNVGRRSGRKSVTGAPRGPLCAMGTCFECRVVIDGRPQQRSCLVLCRDGMEIETAETPVS